MDIRDVLEQALLTTEDGAAVAWEGAVELPHVYCTRALVYRNGAAVVRFGFDLAGRLVHVGAELAANTAPSPPVDQTGARK